MPQGWDDVTAAHGPAWRYLELVPSRVADNAQQQYVRTASASRLESIKRVKGLDPRLGLHPLQ